MLSTDVHQIGVHIPKSRSETTIESERILRSLRDKLETPASMAQEELESLSKLMLKDKEIKQQVSDKLQVTVPKTITRGSVAEALYSCVANASKADSCSPECLTGLPLSGSKNCKVPVYLKTSSSLRKLNDSSGTEANVYTSEAFTGFSDSEEDMLRSQGITSVVLHEREPKSNKYRSKVVTVSSQSVTRTKDQTGDSCSSSKSVTFSDTTTYIPNKPSTKSQSSEPPESHETKKGSYFIYIVLAVLLLLVVLAALAFFWYNSSGESSPSTPKINNSPLDWR
jgi:hypothetical protein